MLSICSFDNNIGHQTIEHRKSQLACYSSGISNNKIIFISLLVQTAVIYATKPTGKFFTPKQLHQSGDIYPPDSAGQSNSVDALEFANSSANNHEEEPSAHLIQDNADYFYTERPTLGEESLVTHSATSNEHHSNHQAPDGYSEAPPIVTQHEEQPISSERETEVERQSELNKEFLKPDLASKACHLNRGCERRDRLNGTYLAHCSRHKLENLLSNEILMLLMHETSSECERVLHEFIRLDEIIDQFDQMFKKLLQRYNCRNGYSVKWNCDDCKLTQHPTNDRKRAYKDWLCATNLPYYMNGERIKPCISFCERVEQRCPYLHPITKEQYGGQPVFICKDPNIPFVREITPDILYSEANKCYDLCHLDVDPLELKQDSLSKYSREQCPANSVLAEEVRSDPFYCQPDLERPQPNSTSTGNSIQEQLDGQSGGSQVDPGGGHLVVQPSGHHEQHAHTKKLNELREVLASYENQPKTHKFGHYSEHSSLSPADRRSLDHSVWSQPHESHHSTGALKGSPWS